MRRAGIGAPGAVPRLVLVPYVPWGLTPAPPKKHRAWEGKEMSGGENRKADSGRGGLAAFTCLKNLNNLSS